MEIDQFFKDLAGPLQAIGCCHIPSLTQRDLPACLLFILKSVIFFFFFLEYDCFTMLSVSFNFGEKMFKSCLSIILKIQKCNSCENREHRSGWTNSLRKDPQRGQNQLRDGGWGRGWSRNAALHQCLWLTSWRSSSQTHQLSTLESRVTFRGLQATQGAIRKPAFPSF